MTTWDALGLGVVTVDDLLYVDDFPTPNSKLEICSEQRQGGGLTATAVVAAARSGARTAFLGILGDDDLSCFAVAELEREGVDCSTVSRRAGARPVHARIIVEMGNGRRTILFTREGAVYPTADEIDVTLSRGCRILLVDPVPGDAAVHAVARARAAGIAVVADVENVAPPSAQFLLQKADHLIIGWEAGRRATGLESPAEIAAALSGPGRACSAVTAGEAGCWYSERGGPVRHIPALKVVAADTTGCGDVFHGAYAAALARDESVGQAIRVANATAGLKATQPGGRAGIPDRATVDRVLSESSQA
jgi:sugar/nucleoside kinase (ribokinase family)